MFGTHKFQKQLSMPEELPAAGVGGRRGWVRDEMLFENKWKILFPNIVVILETTAIFLKEETVIKRFSDFLKTNGKQNTETKTKK